MLQSVLHRAIAAQHRWHSGKQQRATRVHQLFESRFLSLPARLEGKEYDFFLIMEFSFSRAEAQELRVKITFNREVCSGRLQGKSR